MTSPADDAFSIKMLKIRVERLEDALMEARLQIEYLHNKFQETGTGNAVLANIQNALGKDRAG